MNESEFTDRELKPDDADVSDRENRMAFEFGVGVFLLFCIGIGGFFMLLSNAPAFPKGTYFSNLLLALGYIIIFVGAVAPFYVLTEFDSRGEDGG